MGGLLLNVSKLSKHFGADIVLDEVSFRLDRKEKVALVGRNGTGKTTLLKIITGDYEPDGGSATLERGVTVGYLSQVSLPDSSRTVLQVATEARAHLVETQARINQLEAQMEQEVTTEDLDEYSLLLEHFNAQGGYSIENDLKVVLKKLGFLESEFDKPVSALSGGERTRLLLAKLLLEEPEILILDEPTNHLDIDAIEWLEGWIRGYGGAVLVVSHDRVFLNNVCQRVLELRHQKIESFPGPFDTYLNLRKEQDARTEVMAERQAAEMAKLDEFVRRFMNSQRTAQARGRLKMLERMEAQRIIPPSGERNLGATLKVKKRAGDLVFEAKKLTMAFENQKLFQDLNWLAQWGDRWGIIGANGSGKSTLMKLILGELEPISGTTRIGANVDLGWFRQDATFLDPELTPLQTINEILGLEHGPARNLLGQFLISGDDSLRPIKTLSGGERVKVALAVITGMSPNVLVLDEPTNHLDIASREALAEVLSTFNGTLVVISHDRWFLDQVTKKTLDIGPEGIVTFDGPVGEYRRWKSTNEARSASSAAPSALLQQELPKLSPRDLSKEIGRLTKEISSQEMLIEKLEAELDQHEKIMSVPDPNADHYAQSMKHAELSGKVNAALEHWTELSEQLESYKAQQGAGDPAQSR